MIDYLNTHQGAFWFTVGFVLLTLDILYWVWRPVLCFSLVSVGS